MSEISDKELDIMLKNNRFVEVMIGAIYLAETQP